MGATSKLSTENFIRKSKEYYPNRFVYDKTVCQTGQDKVTITCRLHGDFSVLPTNHLRARFSDSKTPAAGCVGCRKKYQASPRSNRKSRTRTNEEVVAECKKVWGDKRFSYDTVVYERASKKIAITCKLHGIFHRTTTDFLYRKRGCPSCQKSLLKERKDLEAKERVSTFVDGARRVHGDKYDYAKVTAVYSYSDKVKIACPHHGIFRQEVSKHLAGQGCYPCGSQRAGEKLRLDQEAFIAKAKYLHGEKFDYSLTNYVSMAESIRIICPFHGEVELLAKAHLTVSGCPFCVVNNSSVSKTSQEWLDSLGVMNREVSIPNLGFRVDGMSDDGSTVYEFNGCFFHGCPRCHEKSEINTKVGRTMGELYRSTKDREELLRDAGYTVVVVWECDFLSVL